MINFKITFLTNILALHVFIAEGFYILKNHLRYSMIHQLSILYNDIYLISPSRLILILIIMADSKYLLVNYVKDLQQDSYFLTFLLYHKKSFQCHYTKENIYHQFIYIV